MEDAVLLSLGAVGNLGKKSMGYKCVDLFLDLLFVSLVYGFILFSLLFFWLFSRQDLAVLPGLASNSRCCNLPRSWNYKYIPLHLF